MVPTAPAVASPPPGRPPLPESHPLDPTCDVAVIGGGLVGLATALALSDTCDARVTVVEAEARVASHQSGHNSGVLHAGLYYAPGSLRARLCRQGRADMEAFCREHEVPWARPGKLVLAACDEELPRLDALTERGEANGLQGLRRLDRRELSGMEPRAAGVAALLVPETGITDFAAVAEAMAAELRRRGVAVETSARLLGVRPEGEGHALQTTAGPLRCRHAVACAGLQADRVARLFEVPTEVVIVPFRGSYRQLRYDDGAPTRHLLYPVPDPSLPFLGVHVTPTIHGTLEVGPDATLAWSRDGYRPGAFRARDAWDVLASRGARRLLARRWRTGLREWRRARSQRLSVEAVRRLLPEVRASDLLPAGSGVRAQAVGPDGALLDDFVIEEGRDSLHVLNAPSPAATASLAIGRHVCDLATRAFSI